MLGMYFFYLYSDKSDLECKIAKEIKLKNLDSDTLSNLGFFVKEINKHIVPKTIYQFINVFAFTNLVDASKDIVIKINLYFINFETIKKIIKKCKNCICDHK